MMKYSTLKTNTPSPPPTHPQTSAEKKETKTCPIL